MYILHTCASYSLLLYSYSEDKLFCSSITDNQEGKKLKNQQRWLSSILFVFFLVFVLLNLCNACLLLFVLFISLCDLAFIYYRSKQQQQQKTNKPCGWLCGAIVHFFLKQRIIRALKKEWRRIIGKWIKIYLILFCFSCYYHSFAYILPIWGMI